MPQSRRVLVSLLTDQQEFQRAQAEAARSAGARAGLQVDVVFAENNPVVQLQQIFRAVREPEERRPGAIVAETGSSTGFEGAARTALAAGIGWVLVSENAPYLEVLRREFPGKLVASVATDDLEVGRLQARILRTLLPQGGAVLTVEGPTQNASAIHRREGLEAGLAGSTVNVVKALTGDWTLSGGEQTVSLWLRLAARGQRPDAVAAQNDELAAGALRAIKARRPDWADVPLIGCDGLPGGGLRLVREGILAATVVTPPPAGPGMELVARAFRGEAIEAQHRIAPQPHPALDQLARRARS